MRGSSVKKAASVKTTSSPKTANGQKPNLTVLPASKSAKAKRFRQTRFENDASDLSIVIQGVEATLKNWSRTGIGFEIPTIKDFAEPGAMIEDVKLYCDDALLFEGTVEIKTVQKIDSEKSFYGASFSSSLFLVEGVNAAVSATSCAGAVETISEEVENADPGFCQSVLALSMALRRIQRECQKQEQAWKRYTFDQRCEAERIFLPTVVRKVKNVFIHFDIKISKQIDVESIPEDSIYHRIFEQELYPFFEGSGIVRRAYEKPRGYAGDYEMMNQIYRDGFEGEDLFGRVLHNYITNENSAESVRFRKPYFLNYYQKLLKHEGNSRVLSIACGPAVEYQEAVEKWSQEDLDRIELMLFDLDAEALEHAQSKIFEKAMQAKKRPNVEFVNASVKSFLQSSIEVNERFDLIYSGGLFDYLDNLTSTALVEKFSSMLNPGGRLIIGNFTKDNLTKAFLHLLTQWTLIHKTEEEMKNWAKNLEGFSTRIEYDRLKMNAFLVVTRDAD